ncbi:MAG: hypothetical protein R2713_11685 [Ilumatobacteraceae bacterium]
MTRRAGSTPSRRRRGGFWVLLSIGALVLSSSCGGDVDVATERSRSAGTDPTELPSTTSPSVDTTRSTTPDAPATSDGPTPTVPPTGAPATSIPATPVGSEDLGYGVSVPVPDGWFVDERYEHGIVLADGASGWVAFESHVRPAGEDPLVLMQEYVDGFDTEFEAITYGPMVAEPRRSLDPPISQHRVYYTTYDPSNVDRGRGLNGGVYAEPGDGLCVIADIWVDTAAAGGGTVEFPDSATTALEDRLSAAPPLGAFRELVDHDPVRLRSAHAEVLVDDLIGFTVAPGFDVVEDEFGLVKVANGTREFEVQRLEGQASVAAALAEAERVAIAGYADVIWDGREDFGTDEYGVEQLTNTFNATWAADGEHCGGIVEAFFDPSTGSAIIVLDDFYWDGGDLPYDAEVGYMHLGLQLAMEHIG